MKTSQRLITDEIYELKLRSSSSSSPASPLCNPGISFRMDVDGVTGEMQGLVSLGSFIQIKSQFKTSFILIMLPPDDVLRETRTHPRRWRRGKQGLN